MRKTLLIIPALLAASMMARADVLDMPSAPAATTAVQPHKGEAMASVGKRLGEPLRKFPPAGGDTQRHPPITRWDYAAYSVFFEHGHVIDVVVPGNPAPLHNTDELKKN